MQIFEKLEEYKTQLIAYKEELIGYKNKAHYWEAQFMRVKEREREKESQLEELKAKLKKRDHQLFGKKSEKRRAKSESSKEEGKGRKNKRGQQKTNRGPQRKDYSHLPSSDEEIDLLEKDKRCPCCQLPYTGLSKTEDSTIIEVVNVQGYRRKIRRKMYKPTCQCPGSASIITAPIPNKLIAKSRFGISIWAYLLIEKYHYQRPQHNTLKALSNNGLELSASTLIGGYKVVMERYLMPIYDLIQQRSVRGEHWHADETGWKVFEELKGKKNNRWWMWIFKNKETVVFKIDPRRSSQVLKEYFGEDSKGILSVDRYGAYKVIAKSGLFTLAFCWAHVRRDFLEHGRAFEREEEWALGWVKRIGELYAINNRRMKKDAKSKKFKELQKELKGAIESFKKEVEREQTNLNLLPSARKILKSLKKHWDGLTVFVDKATIPMDNNQAENGLRRAVVGRKGYYGSGAKWTSELAAILFSIFGTLECWKINPHSWLICYLHECAMHGTAPRTIEKYLPWNMTEEQRQELGKPLEPQNTS